MAYASISLFITEESQDKKLKQGSNLEAAADAEAMEGAAYLLAFPDLLSLLSYIIQDHQAGLAPLTMG